MQRGFAMSAATSNLFQPYNVGKFNLGAAVGGYNSENAVAVGSGYRFNENVAVKASLATSTSNGGDVMYGAGMNLEWSHTGIYGITYFYSEEPVRYYRLFFYRVIIIFTMILIKKLKTILLPDLAYSES